MLAISDDFLGDFPRVLATWYHFSGNFHRYVLRPRLKPFLQGKSATLRKGFGTLYQPAKRLAKRQDHHKKGNPLTEKKGLLNAKMPCNPFRDVILFFTQSQYKYFSHFSGWWLKYLYWDWLKVSMTGLCGSCGGERREASMRGCILDRHPQLILELPLELHR